MPTNPVKLPPQEMEKLLHFLGGYPPGNEEVTPFPGGVPPRK